MHIHLKRLGCGLCLLLLPILATTAGAQGDQRLVTAVRQRDRLATQALLKQKVDVNVPQPDGSTALHWAAHGDDLESVQLLLRAGANVNAVNDFGVTALA